MYRETRKNLIISPSGSDNSCHKEWIKGKRDFDLMLVNYSDVSGRYKDDADYYFEARGFKFEILKDAIEANVDLVKRYDFVWLPDDDLSIRTEDINKLFDIFNVYRLDYGQPSVKNNYCIHYVTRRRINCVLRYVNFIELMCPLFRTTLLFRVLDTFKLNKSAYGIDWIWAERLNNKRIAIIDAVAVFHTKPLYSGLYYQKLRELGVSCDNDVCSVFRSYNLRKHYEEYDRVFKPWSQKLGIFGTSNITERLLLKGQSLFYQLANHV